MIGVLLAVSWILTVYLIWFAVELHVDLVRQRRQSDSLRKMLDQVETHNRHLQSQLDERTAERLGW